MNSIKWPIKYQPGETDNFASNEKYVKNGDFLVIVNNLLDTATWPQYYNNATNIVLADGTTVLKQDLPFSFDTFGLAVQCKVEECKIDTTNNIACIAWSGVAGQPGTSSYLDVYHAWIIEEVDGKYIRILTQESQIGEAAMALDPSHPIINGHQDWIDGLAKYSK